MDLSDTDLLPADEHRAALTTVVPLPAERPLRVLLVINRLGDQGGAENSTATLVRELQGTYANFCVLTLGEPVNSRERGELERRGVRFEVTTGGLIAQVNKVRALLDDFEPDFVHAVLFNAELAARIGAYRRKPVLASIVNSQYSEAAQRVARSPRKLEFVRRLDSLLARYATFWFHAVSSSAATEAVRQLRIPPGRVTVVRRGRDRQSLGEPSPARADRVRAELGLDDKQAVLLAVARHEPQKQLDLLVEAFATLPPALESSVLLVAGRDGSSTALVKETIDRLGVGGRVRLLGHREDVPDLLCAADISILSSAYEGLPGVALESLAMSTPMVAFDTPMTREALGGAGILVPQGNVRKLADAIAAILDDAELADQIAKAGQERFDENFTVERYTTDFARLYLNLGERIGARR